MTSGFNMLTYVKMHKDKQVQSPSRIAPPRPKITGMKMMTYDEMRNHQHIENPQCACYNIDAVLAKVPKDQQGQFVRVFPSSQPRYTNHPTGVSMFREEMDLDMTVPRNSAEQPQPSLHSWAMAPETAEKYTGMRGLGGPPRQDKNRTCVPQMTTVVSGIFTRALHVVQHRSRPSSPATVDSYSEEESPLGTPVELVPGDVRMPQPPPSTVPPLQRSNAVRYPTNPRPRSRIRQNSMLRYHPGGEADTYYLADFPHNRSARRSTCPDSYTLKSKQRRASIVKGSTYSHVERYAIPSVYSPRTRAHIDDSRDESRPPSMTGMPGLPPPYHRNGYLRWQDHGTMNSLPNSALASSSSSDTHVARDVNFHEKLAASASLCYQNSIPDDFSSSSSSSSSDRPTHTFRNLNDPDEKILSQMREFAGIRCSPDYPTRQTRRPRDVSDGIPKAVPASRRFSLDEFSTTDAVLVETRFSMSSASDGEPETFATGRRRLVDNDGYDADVEDNEEKFFADDDMGFYKEPSDDDNGSIDQSLFVGFDGDFDSKSSPSNFSKSAFGSERTVRIANRSSLAHDVGPDDGGYESGWDADDEGDGKNRNHADEFYQRGRSRKMRPL
jgi:hypothetical protein